MASLGQERADHQEERKEKERDESADLRGAADMKLPTKVVVDHVQKGGIQDQNKEGADQGQKLIAQYMENLLDQQRHHVQEEVMRTLNYSNHQDDEVREPYFGTNSQATRMMRHKRHSHNPAVNGPTASLMSGMNRYDKQV